MSSFKKTKENFQLRQVNLKNEKTKAILIQYFKKICA